jgi:hypothetical protein
MEEFLAGMLTLWLFGIGLGVIIILTYLMAKILGDIYRGEL